MQFCPIPQVPGEKIYEEWDCPKVQILEDYKPGILCNMVQNINIFQPEVASQGSFPKRIYDNQKVGTDTKGHEFESPSGTAS